jgi:hypothetical protein
MQGILVVGVDGARCSVAMRGLSRVHLGSDGIAHRARVSAEDPAST